MVSHRLADVEWLVHPDETLSIVRSSYLAVPDDMPLWESRRSFRPANTDAIAEALGVE